MLRGIAVFGILLMNVWSFVWGFEILRYGVLPDPASLADRMAVFSVALIAEQKFYPIFAFLFGAGFALQTRSLKRTTPDWSGVRAKYRRRLRWLLGCGILHATLVWAGDILTVYGITGFLILRLAGARLKKICGDLWNWCVVWLVLITLNIVISLQTGPDDARSIAISAIKNVQAAHAVYAHDAGLGHLVQRLADYASVTLASVLLVPHLVVLFLLGILSVRLGWLTAPWRHTALWRRVRAIGYGIGIPFNLFWAGTAMTEAIDPLDAALHLHVATVHALLPIGGSLLAAGYVASVMLAARKTMRGLSAWLAPVGRMSLTNYLAQSVLCVALLQGVGMGIGAVAPPAALLVIAAAIMLLQALVSRWWLSRYPQGPVESLYTRKAGSGYVRP